jgi:hypothetical protein
MNADQHEWEIGLSSWMIQDGNYANFTTGQHAEFALDFYAQNICSSESKTKYAKRLDAAKYEINAEVVYLSSEICVLDFGICAFQESASPKEMSVGKFVTAEISLGIDPFDYFERLYKLPGMRPLIYSWKINSIRQQTAPFIETRNASGQKVFVRDETKLGYKKLEKTDAWKDDDGHGEYILNCIRFDVAPKFESVTAT